MSRFANVGQLPASIRKQAQTRLAAAGAVRIIRCPDDDAQRGAEHTGMLLWQLKALDLPAPQAEFRFDEHRKWRFDLAWPIATPPLAVEIEGLTHEGGRHQRIEGFNADCRKYLAAIVAGWTVVRVTPDMIHKGEAIIALEQLLKK